MDGGDGLGDGGKAHGVGPDGSQITDLRRGLQARPHESGIDTGFQRDTGGGACLQGLFDKKRIVDGAHVRKAQAPGILVGAVEGIGAGQVDVIPEEHDISGEEGGVDPAGRIGEEEHPNAQFLHDPDGEGDLLGGVPFIEMEPPLEGHDRFSGPAPENELSRVAFHGGSGEIGDLPIIDYFRNI